MKRKNLTFVMLVMAALMLIGCQKTYKVTFLEDDGTFYKSIKAKLHEPIRLLTGENNKPDDELYTYRHSGWIPEKQTDATKDQTFTKVYDLFDVSESEYIDKNMSNIRLKVELNEYDEYTVIFSEGSFIPSHYKSIPITNLAENSVNPGTNEVVISGRIKIIDSNVCYNKRNTRKITLLPGVTEIAEEAFYGVSSLTTVNLPDTLKRIGSKAFQGTNITKIIIPNSVTYFGMDIFDYGTTIFTYFEKNDQVLLSYPLWNSYRKVYYKDEWLFLEYSTEPVSGINE